MHCRRWLKCMGNRFSFRSGYGKAILCLLVLIALSGCLDRWRAMFPKTVTWKEEVKLSDSSILIVTRTNHLVPPRSVELGQKPHLRLGWTKVEFEIPGSNEKVMWKSDWSFDSTSDRLQLLGIDIIDGIAYLVAKPDDCNGVVVWHWPDPMYVFLKWEHGSWMQLDTSSFPKKITQVTLLLSGQSPTYPDEPFFGYVDIKKHVEIESESVLISQGEIGWGRQFLKNNDSIYLHRGLRKKTPKEACPDDAYIGMEGFQKGLMPIYPLTMIRSLEECLNACKSIDISSKNCPCKDQFSEVK